MKARGFTLVELMVAVVVMSILGVALTRMLISDSRFASRQDAMISARHGGRAAMNTMAVELRMVGDGGLIAAAPESVIVNVPYAFGMSCRVIASGLIASLMPPDSLAYATASPDGMAWRDDAGNYTTIAGVSVGSSNKVGQCTADSIRVVTGGMVVAIGDVGASPPPPGQLFYLYQTTRYRFSASTEMPGRTALWRKAGVAPYEEVVVPFDDSAEFACLVGAELQAVACPATAQGGLAAVRGLELRLVSASEAAPQGATAPETFSLITQVHFLNKVN